MRGGGGRLTCHITADASSWRRTHDRDLRPTEGGVPCCVSLSHSVSLASSSGFDRFAGEEAWRNSRGFSLLSFAFLGNLVCYSLKEKRAFPFGPCLWVPEGKYRALGGKIGITLTGSRADGRPRISGSLDGSSE